MPVMPCHKAGKTLQHAQEVKLVCVGCSHAILEAWGQSPRTHMLISDIDEYFVFPTKTMTLNLVLQKCTENKAQVRAKLL